MKQIRKTYTGKITMLKPNQIFVFGSNTEGKHGKGSARFAYDFCGAIYGRAAGLQGQSFAIITKDMTKAVHPSVDEFTIKNQIMTLYLVAANTKSMEYLVPYKATGKNLNGYTAQQMAKMFAQFPIPENIIFEKQFWNLILSYGHKEHPFG